MPTKLTPFERSYIRTVNTYGFFLLAAHLPVLCLLALFEGSSVMVAALVMLLLLSGPAAVLINHRGSQLGATALAVAAMGMCALTIYLANGMIEAHFEVFVLIALLTVFGRITPLVTAFVVISLHHLLFWLWLPTFVFNYKASLAIVLVHACFVALEVVPACFIARQLGRSIKAQGLVTGHLEAFSQQIATAASEVAASSRSLAEGVSQQASSIAETSLSIGEITTMAHRNTSSSIAAAQLVLSGQLQFDETNQSLDEMVHAMEGLDDSSDQIAKIIKVIDQIAFQTSILALNAAVEAARAGTAGAGFAVVADEVRSLAQRSAHAARDTAALIEDSIARTQAGKLKVDKVALAIRSITVESIKMKAFIDEISAGSKDQCVGIEHISRAIRVLEQVTLTNATGSAQTAAAAEALTAQSHVIQQIVTQLSALGASQRSSPALPPRANASLRYIPREPKPGELPARSG